MGWGQGMVHEAGEVCYHYGGGKNRRKGESCWNPSIISPVREQALPLHPISAGAQLPFPLALLPPREGSAARDSASHSSSHPFLHSTLQHHPQPPQNEEVQTTAMHLRRCCLSCRNGAAPPKVMAGQQGHHYFIH